MRVCDACGTAEAPLVPITVRLTRRERGPKTSQIVYRCESCDDLVNEVITTFIRRTPLRREELYTCTQGNSR